MPDFLYMMKNMTRSRKDIAKMNRYFIGRGDKRFWKTYDWFQHYFNKSEPINAGLYDLNRYAPQSLDKLDKK